MKVPTPQEIASLQAGALVVQQRDHVERPTCPVCDGLPIDMLATDQDGNSIVHPLARRCCNEACDETWGTGCYHCHWYGFFDRVETLAIVEGL